MAKKVIAQIKLQIPAGQANPSPPIGPALGQHGVNIMEFCKSYNAKTAGQEGTIIPVLITVLRRPLLHLRDQDPAGLGAAQAGGPAGQGGQGNRAGEGGPDHQGATGGDRPARRCRI